MRPLVLIALALVAAGRAASGEQCVAVSPATDCGWPGVSEGACASMGCCWRGAPASPRCVNRANPEQVPSYGTYAVTQTNAADANGPFVFKAAFQPHQGAAPPASGPSAPWAELIGSVDLQTEARVRVQLAPDRLPGAAAWQVPDELLASPYNDEKPHGAANNSLYEVSTPAAGDALAVRVTRRSDGAVLFDTADQRGLVAHEQYVELSVPTGGRAVVGAGERIDPLRLPEGDDYTIFSRDPGGNPEHLNLYGAHPFVMLQQPNGTASGVFFFNSNDMDVHVGAEAVTFRSTGGILDFFVFAGPRPADVLAQYHEVIGRPFMPPYWALGFHQCRWGYSSVQELRDVVSGYEAHGLPLDTMWNDIDYMEAYHDFTLAPGRYDPADMRKFHEWVAQRDQHHVYIVDPAIPAIDGYAPYMAGLDRGVFVRSAANTSRPVFNKVWPHEPAAFPDFAQPSTEAWWQQQIAGFFELGGAASGLWIDMNEPAAFCTGQFPSNCRLVTGPPWSEPTTPLPPAHLPGNVTMAVPPPDGTPETLEPVPPPAYLPGGAQMYESTLNMSSLHGMGRHYDVHSLYGHLEMRATVKALRGIDPARRPFVLTRSSFAGTGSMGAHWGGDNYSTFQSMRDSLKQLLTLGMFGIASTGSDICGFFGNTTEELCSRWMAVGSLYPFSRNHNMWNTVSQEPYAFGNDSAVLKASVDSLKRRYSLLPYLSTLHRLAHRDGGAVMRPLFVEFPDAGDAVWSIDDQFMLGPALLVSPVLEKGAESVQVPLPPGARWYSWDKMLGGARDGGQTVTVENKPGDVTPVHIRAGTIVPTHANPDGFARSSADYRKLGYRLQVWLDPMDAAAPADGALFVDDGVSPLGQGKAEAIVELRWRRDPAAFAAGHDGFSLELRPDAAVGDDAPDSYALGAVGVTGVQLNSSRSLAATSWPVRVVDAKTNAVLYSVSAAFLQLEQVLVLNLNRTVKVTDSIKVLVPFSRDGFGADDHGGPTGTDPHDHGHNHGSGDDSGSGSAGSIVGAIAGVAVACAIGGAVFWWLKKRRESRGPAAGGYAYAPDPSYDQTSSGHFQPI